MRIALHTGGRQIRGNEQQVLLLARGLRARGHDVFASAIADSETYHALVDAGVHVTSTRPRGDADVVSLLRFTAWLRRTSPDALLATSWKRAFVVLLAARLAGVPRRVLRTGYASLYRTRPGDWLRAHALGTWASACYVNSAELRERLLAYTPALRPECVSIVQNAVAFQDVAPAPLRRTLGVAAGDPLIISAGGLEARKGFDLLLRACARLDDLRAHVVIAGDGPERDALRAHAAELGIGQRVHLLGHRSDVPALLKASDVFVLASRLDSAPNVVLEAMAAGVPVVSTAVDGIEEFIGERAGHGAAGWIVPIGDAEAIARAVRSALTAPDASKRVREAQHRIREDHSPERLVTAVEALLRGR